MDGCDNNLPDSCHYVTVKINYYEVTVSILHLLLFVFVHFCLNLPKKKQHNFAHLYILI